MSNDLIKPIPFERLAKPLVCWYDTSARILPWREDPTPYHVWVSEIMLQQTRVEAVKPYYARFLQMLPDIRSLAECPEETLLKLWEGLGYYNRARNLKRCAQEVCAHYDGVLPADYEALKKLPGIGPYTAGAIASIAYGIPVPAVDGNVLRILMRVTGCEADIAKESVKKAVTKAALCWMRQAYGTDPSSDADSPGIWNQALMELGAVVCVPNGDPLCEDCPWQPYCAAFRTGQTGELPRKSRPGPRRVEQRTVLLISDGEGVVLKRRPLRGLLAGMYEFPNVSGHLSEEEALAAVRAYGLTPLHIRKAADAKHIFSHVEWHMTGFVIRTGSFPGEKNSLLFASAEEIRKRYPVPAAFEAYQKELGL